MDGLSEQVKAPTADGVFAGGGDMGALMRSMDWSKTRLGPVENWPQSLRTAVSICLASHFPMLIWWGPELVKLYNDAYRPMLGATKHPMAMGQPGRECWPEIWDIIGPMLEGVLREGKATWSENQLLLLERNGYPEECYFTFSYSPIRDESGGIGGVFTAVTETTQQVLSERRLDTLRELATSAYDAQTAEDACQIAARVLEKNTADIPFALLYLLDSDGKQARLVGVSGFVDGALISPPQINLSTLDEQDEVWPLAQAVHTGQAAFVTKVAGLFGPEHLPALPNYEDAIDHVTTRQSALALPIIRPGQKEPYGLFVAGISPILQLNEHYRGFFTLVASQVASAVANVRAYQEARAQANALAELDRAKTIFFSNVSHEFRTPLTLLLGPIEDALADTDHVLQARQRERLEIVRRNALRLLKLVNILLDFSRIEVGRAQAVYEPTDLAALTSDLASIFRSAIERAGLRFEVDCPPLPEVVYVDGEMWEKIVLNLLSNAFKFTFAGQITVALRSTGDQVQLEVADTGTGIPAEELPLIFQRFHRVHNTHARTHEGTGIGLSLVQELVRLHGGTVQVESALGQGTTLTVSIPPGTSHLPADRLRAARKLQSIGSDTAYYIEEAQRLLLESETNASATKVQATHQSQRSAPLRPASDPAVSAQSRSDNEASSSTASQSVQTGAIHPAPTAEHILLADDNADMREYLERLLSEHWSVEAVSNGMEALEAAHTRLPDLVLSDVMMPEMDGFQLLQALRSDPRTATIPIILLSARAGEESSVEGLQAGADDYLVKPFSARELLARVSTHLELARIRREIASRAREHADRLQRLANASLIITATPMLDERLRRITGEAREIIGAHQAITSMNTDENWTQAITVVSFSEKYARWHDYSQPPPDSNAHALILNPTKPIRLTQAELEMHPAWQYLSKGAGKLPPMRGWLAAPLTGHDGQQLGILQLSDKYEGEFTEEDETILLQLAQLASATIENARLYQNAQDAIHLRDELFSIVSHDLKNPVATIKGFAQLLKRILNRMNLPDKEQQAQIVDGLSRIDLTATRMTTLINELLDIAHLQIGKPLNLDQRETDLVRLAHQAVISYQQTTQRHRFHIEIGEPELVGWWDTVRLERVLGNLLSNAVKYSPEGGIITVKVTKEGDQWAVLSVEDQGVGIPADDLPHIFDRFHRAANVAGQIKGSGLGLASAHQIIKQHGGTITVTSQQGKGATFTVRLPLNPPDEDANA